MIMEYEEYLLCDGGGDGVLGAWVSRCARSAIAGNELPPPQRKLRGWTSSLS